MKFRTIMLALLGATIIVAPAEARKKKDKKKPVTVTLQPVPADTFSYAMGVAQAQSLKTYLVQRMGVDSAYVGVAAQALREAASLSSEEIKKRAAYAAGLQIAEMNKTQVIPSLNQQAAGSRDTTYADLTAFTRGLVDVLEGKATLSPDSAMSIAERQMKYRQEIVKIEQEQYKAENQAWLAKNAKEKGVKTTESGLQYRIIKQGTGAVATDSTDVEAHYEGKLINGKIFDSSYKRGEPLTFKPNGVIKGWREALTMMPEGSVYELFIPYELGYGERGAGEGIPPYSTLIFKVEVVKVKQ